MVVASLCNRRSAALVRKTADERGLTSLAEPHGVHSRSFQIFRFH